MQKIKEIGWMKLEIWPNQTKFEQIFDLLTFKIMLNRGQNYQIYISIQIIYSEYHFCKKSKKSDEDNLRYGQIRPNRAKLGKNLTFDPLPPANKNFRKYNTQLSLSPLSGSKSCQLWKKSNEAFLRCFEKCWFFGQNGPFCTPVEGGREEGGAYRIFFKISALSLFLLFWCLTLCKISKKSYEWFLR